jgi:small subunit ribosomal protein S19
MPKFEYRGKSTEELKAMGLEEFRKLVPARQKRSLKRGFREAQKKLLKSIREDRNKFHRLKCRDIIIIPEMIGVKLGVHNGKEYVQIEVRPEMVGHRVGEFAPTRKIVKHSAPGFGATRSSKYIPLK